MRDGEADQYNNTGVKKSPASILGRWEGEDANRRRQAQESMNELARSLGTTTLDGMFSSLAPYSPLQDVRSAPRVDFVLEEMQDDEDEVTERAQHTR